MKTRVWMACLGAGLLAVTGAACSSSAHQTHGPLETTNITVADFPSVNSAGLYIALQQGLFKQQGLNVKIVPNFTSTQVPDTDIETGKADVASSDYVTFLENKFLQNKDLEIIGEGSTLVPDEMGLIGKATSKIQTVPELVGRTVSITAPNDIATLLLDSLLTDNGIPIKGKVPYKYGVPLPAAPALISSGAAVAAPAVQPFVAEAEQQFGESIFADFDQGSTQNFPVQGFAVMRSWAQQNPNTLKAFVTALDEGQQIADSDRAAVEKAIVAPPLSVKKQIATVMPLPEFPLAVDPTRLQRVLSLMVQFGFLPAKDSAYKMSSMVYSGNVAGADGAAPGMDTSAAGTGS